MGVRAISTIRVTLLTERSPFIHAMKGREVLKMREKNIDNRGPSSDFLPWTFFASRTMRAHLAASHWFCHSCPSVLKESAREKNWRKSAGVVLCSLGWFGGKKVFGMLVCPGVQLEAVLYRSMWNYTGASTGGAKEHLTDGQIQAVWFVLFGQTGNGDNMRWTSFIFHKVCYF